MTRHTGPRSLGSAPETGYALAAEMAPGRAPSRESAPEIPSGDSLSVVSEEEPSVTDVGEPVLVRASAIEISRGSILAGRYQVEAVIGRGGSGIVLRAFDRVTQVAVAVKVLKPDLASDPRWVERFSRELRLARQIQHDHLCRVFDIGQADGHWFITMELATGGTLRDRFGEEGRKRPFEDKVTDARAVVAGLAAIHAAGILHRDLKPDNFLRLADGRLVMSDFGLATNPSDGSMVSVMVGTPAYMAPEVVVGEQASFQSDVWSLGVVLHELFFNSRPERNSVTNGRTGVRPPERKLSPVERAIARFVERCLEDDLAWRPADGVAAKKLFEEALASKGTLLPRPGRRHLRWALPAAVAAGAISLAVVTGHWWRGATASSGSRGATSRGAPEVRGVASDWSGIGEVASFEEPIHCISWLQPDRVLQVVLGTDRRAVEIDVATKAVRSASIPARAFAIGCPQLSKQGALLFEAFDEGGRGQILLAPSMQRLSEAKPITQGSAPVWFPSGNEFVYKADDSHAAVFSLPVMSTTIVNEAAQDAGLLMDEAVSPNGRSLTLRYLDGSMQWHVVLHDLPSLAAVHTTVFPRQAIDLEFFDETNVAFALSEPPGMIIATLDPRTGQVRRVGASAGHIPHRPVRGEGVFAIIDAAPKSDIWRIENGVRTTRLTEDGQSMLPDLSTRGDLILQRMGYDQKATLWLQRKGQPPRMVSNGPADYAPHFLPDGSGWLYTDGERRAIRRCDLAGSCVDIYTDESDLPFHPVASLDQGRIAFISTIGRQRLKVVSANGKAHDLGPARPECAPSWTADGQLWVLQGTEQKLFWSRVNATTGEQTATVPIASGARPEGPECGVIDAPPGALRPREVTGWRTEVNSIKVVSLQQYQVGGHQP